MNSRDTIPLDDALGIVDETLAGAKLPVETVPVCRALTRVLRTDVASRVDLPPFNKSAMDGYAILEGDEREEYRLLGTVAAGEVCTFELPPGTTVKVMTGAPVPDGAARVVMIEHTEEQGGMVKVYRHDGKTNICRQAEDVRTGDVVMRAGTTLGPLEIGNLVSCGVTEVEVTRAVRVAVISTGDEIVDDPVDLAPGKIMNVNGPMLAALARARGFEVVGEWLVGDEHRATAATLREALACADVVIASGGVSVGDYDYVLGALGDAGLTVYFSRVAVKPGRPTVYASAPGGKGFFGLPGNPVSVYLMFHLFVLRAAAHMTGGAVPMREMTLRMASGFSRRKTDRVEFVPARLIRDARVEPIAYHGSAHLMAVMEADGFCIVPVGVGKLAANDEVTFVPLGRIATW